MFRSIYRTSRTAIRALLRNVMRSRLTCLGIIIGIASVIAMAEIGQGSSNSIQQTIASMGANVVQIDPDAALRGGVSTGGGGRASLTAADADAIARECDGILWSVPSID